MFIKEEIPDKDRLFRRIHKQYLTRAGRISPSGFKGNTVDKNSMSTNWEKYSTPILTKEEAPTPGDNAVISFNAGEAREMQEVDVKHEPIPVNRAHSSVAGVLSPKVRTFLNSISKMEVPLEVNDS